MNEPIAAYPLAWPIGWKRAAPGTRTSARLTKNGDPLSVFSGVERVTLELSRIGIGRDDMVISTNIETRMDGFPRSDRGNPTDPGVAVYWQTKKRGRRCMAIDRYTRVGDNLAAIAATLDAMRAIERHGGAEVLERAFTGFTALPAPTGPRWWTVFGVDQNEKNDVVRDVYRRMRGRGTDAEQASVNVAWDQFTAERGVA